MQVFCPLVIPFGHVQEKWGIEGVRRNEGVFILMPILDVLFLVETADEQSAIVFSHDEIL